MAVLHFGTSTRHTHSLDPSNLQQTDGSKLAIAKDQLFMDNGADDEVVQAANMGGALGERSSAIGRYGPADTQVDTGGHQARKVGIYHDYKVVVKKSCDDDDPDADRYVLNSSDLRFKLFSSN